ncbi:MAG TPA: hypothetical protein VKN14_05605 [Flavobacteriaceae bacterium]|nr:hypothetical protein [Flavobacteriaceae bacterium]
MAGKNLTTEDLAQSLSRIRGTEPLLVNIQTAAGGAPTNRMVGISYAHQGFDWTANMFVMQPAEPIVVVRKLPGSIREFGKEKLEKLKDAHTKMGFKYIAKTREHEWLDGFVAGVKTHITAAED